MKQLIDRLAKNHTLSDDEYIQLLTTTQEGIQQALFDKAKTMQNQIFGKNIYTRGLIELTNHCKKDCLYCGIRASNKKSQRYRLSKQALLDCCDQGHQLGFRTFVLQGGEDPWFDDEKIMDLIHSIKSQYPDCALTLSLGEKSKKSYQMFYNSGADRYLLRHETADKKHFRQLHPPSQTLESRMNALYDLKEIGFQVGCGLMVGSPFQTIQHLIKDLHFIQSFQPHMVGLGPFLPHHATPFSYSPPGDVNRTLRMLAIIRLLLPYVLMPATTALATAVAHGHLQGLEAGANVVMPNLTPNDEKDKYLLYDNKNGVGQHIQKSYLKLQQQCSTLGYQMVIDRGDHPENERNRYV